MVRVLIYEPNKVQYSRLARWLSDADDQQYEICWQPDFCQEYLENNPFQVILVIDDTQSNQPFTTIQDIVHLETSAPIIFLANSASNEVDDQVMQLGASDCLPLAELTPILLKRSIRHAIGRQNTEAQLSFVATHDQLTGLANRYLFHEHLAHAISVAKRRNSCFGLLFLDLDQFKRVNDSLGHDVGDMLIIEIANRLRQAVRLTDIVARMGGDEFTILLEDIKGKKELSLIASKIQSAIEPIIKIQNQELYATASIGIASFPECGLEAQTLMKSADIALNKAKELGRNKFHYFSSELNEQAKLKLELERNLRRALIKGEFEIYYQPQVNAADYKVSGFEALLRWNHPTIGLVSPADFLPLLEELGLMVGVEQWVIKNVCRTAKEITDSYGPLRFAINISGTHFKLGNLKQSLYMAIQESSLDASYLEIELTEDIMIEHVERNNHMLNELAEVGISIALDDFGKGYSSLSYLKNFPANILKIDKSFIDSIQTSERESSIVEAIIGLSHKLGIKVVAEGVEEANQAAILHDKHCDYIQGYHFAKPMSLTNLKEYLSLHFVETTSKQQLQKQINQFF
jgi:diguanylate cyclase